MTIIDDIDNGRPIVEFAYKRDEQLQTKGKK